MRRPATGALLATLVLLLLARCAPPSASGGDPAVTDARLADADHDQGWLTYRRTYDAHEAVPFAQVDRSNVTHLRQVFSYATGFRSGHEATPLVNGTTLYFTTPLSRIIALDARTGTVRWRYDPGLRERGLWHLCCEPVNRGVALYGDAVYVVTIDGRLICLDAGAGAVRWSVDMTPPGRGYSFTSAPLAADGKIIVGSAGGEFPVRGFIAAYDPKNGALIWKRFTAAARGERGGETWPNDAQRWGAAPWQVGSYEPATHTLYWATGNPMPWLGDRRAGDNLFSDCILALDARTGAMRWYYQSTPHDVWDYDGNNELVLADLPDNGRARHVLFQFNRDGWLIVLDRRTGVFLRAHAFVHTDVVLGYDARGRARIAAAKVRRAHQTITACPGTFGGKNWPPSSFDARTSIAYLNSMRACTTFASVPVRYAGEWTDNGTPRPIVGPDPSAPGYGELQAIDVRTGRRLWSHVSALPRYDGTLVTGSGLLFTGTADGWFEAYDARNGRRLWHTRFASGIIGPPISYMVDGTQYIAVLSGWGGAVVNDGPLAHLVNALPRGGRLYVFALPDKRR